MKMIWLVIVVLLLLCGSGTGSGVGAQSLDGCPNRCGDVEIPYPFGTELGCYFRPTPMDMTFFIICKSQADSAVPIPYLGPEGLDVFDVANISLSLAELQISSYLARDCYDRYGNTTESYTSSVWISPYTISDTRNKFVAVGCDTTATIEGYRGDKQYTTGCVASCQEGDNYGDRSCTGVGCCQVSIPKGLENMTIQVSSFYKHSYVWGFNPCSYAFVIEQGKFEMSNSSFDQLNVTGYYPPFVVNWSVGQMRCKAAEASGNFLCKANTECVDSVNGPGYLCQCRQGYQGNPYLPQGCHDIDECMTSNPCVNATCNNTPGSYTCSCELGYSLINNGTSCTRISASNNGDRSDRLLLYIPLSVSIGFIALAAASFMMLWGIRKRKLTKLKEKFFEQNGGLMLQQRLSVHRASMDTTRIYTLEELKTATNNFHESRILGEGGYGTVYKGILADDRVVAVKKSKIGFKKQNEQFINEVIVLMQVNHKNVVKLFGCCLETEVPILVYEFIDNRTLFDHIHNKRKLRLETLSWDLRLKIAAETADALAYLHYQTSTPIFHRDVKSANILLDKSYTAKVSDFGASRLIPLDEEFQLQTFVQGTLGYLDPEYMLTSQLTAKSDVYSFGVVLAELLTSRRVVLMDELETDRNLANLFVCAMKENRLVDILDMEIASGINVEEVAELARRCLRVRGEERPTMKDVAAELADLARVQNHPWRQTRSVTEETDYLLGSPMKSHSAFGLIVADQSSSLSIQNQITHSYGEGR